MNNYLQGETVHFTATFKVGNTLTDPTTVLFTLEQPSGAIVLYTFGVDAEIVKDAVGTYHADLAVYDGVGEGRYRWEGIGVAPGVEEALFFVLAGAVIPPVPIPVIGGYVPTMPLADYIRIIGIDECSFWGVNRVGQTEWGCGRFWDEYKRDSLREALQIAQERIEMVIGYPLGRKIICNEQLSYNWQTHLAGPTRWLKLLTIGQDATVEIADDTPLTLRDSCGDIIDPVIILVTTDATDSCEIHVYHTEDNEGAEIEPKSIYISGGVATIKIPRCRLVNPTIAQPVTGYVYETDSNFVDEVDVKRVYVDQTLGTSLLYHPCGQCTCCSVGLPCENSVQEACGIIRDPDAGSVLIRPASYTAGAWSSETFLCNRVPFAAKMSYIAGVNDQCSAACDQIPRPLRSAIFRLAHTEMPQALCSCSIHEETWILDRTEAKKPDWHTMRDNPFGVLNGQIYAWQAIRPYLSVYGGVL